MANNQITVEFHADAVKTELMEVSAATAELTKQAKGLHGALSEAFKIRGVNDYWKTVREYGKNMADSLLVLQLRMGQLRVAIVDAAVPLASVFLPTVNRAALALTRFFRTMGDVLSILLLGKNAMGQMAGSTGVAGKNQEKFRKSLSATGRTAQKSLASFDELNRMNKSYGGGGGGAVSFSGNVTAPRAISAQAIRIAEQIRQLLLPLTQISFSAVTASFCQLKEAMGAFLGEMGQQLQWVWFQILVPLGKWTIEKLAPATVGVLTEAFRLLTAALTPVFAGLQNLLTALAPVGSFIQDVLLLLLGTLQERFSQLAQVFTSKSEKITEIITMFGELVAQLWTIIEPVLRLMLEGFTKAFDGVWQVGQTCISGLIDVLHTLLQFVTQIFAGDFAAAWDTIGSALSQWTHNIGSTLWSGLSVCAEHIIVVFSRMGSALGNVFGGVKNTVRGAVNGIIGFINGMISGVVSGINAMTRALNKIHFSVPAWVPVLGGRSFGFYISAVQAPQIPYLAKGAVLPANKPFMAMVGDQKHGTNIEAPLATIQEAVANVMGDMQGGMMAGFEASVAVQREILEAILGITIGDDVIAGAVSSYNRKMAVVNGGGIL